MILKGLVGGGGVFSLRDVIRISGCWSCHFKLHSEKLKVMRGLNAVKRKRG